MNNLSDKVSYLRGLVEGMNFVEGDNTSKLILKIIDVLDAVSDSIDEINENVEELGDYIECVDEDLEALEFDDEDYDCDCDFDEDDDEIIDEDDDDDEDDDEDEDDDDELVDIDDEDDQFGMYEGCLCPECGGIFSIAVSDDENQQYICPHCEKRVSAVKMNCKNVPVANACGEDDDE